MASLVQQRMALERRRSFGIIWLVLGVLYCAGAVVQVSTDGRHVWWANLAIGCAWIGVGYVELRRSQRALTAFEAEHGADAGRR
jgi:hypothetical protein